MNKEIIVKSLTEFNKSAEELANLSFIEKMKDSGYNIKLNKNEPPQIIFRGPDDEAVKAFVNDVRRFFQKGKTETLKIHKLIPAYQSNFIEESEKKLFNNEIRDFDLLKRKQSNIRLETHALTKWEILEVFLYGKISHRSEGLKEIHDEWEKNSVLYTVLKNEFLIVLYDLLLILNNIVYANKKVLERLNR